jgi:hypothetical protein
LLNRPTETTPSFEAFEKYLYAFRAWSNLEYVIPRITGELGLSEWSLRAYSACLI